MMAKKLGKFEISQCSNGFILSLINPNYQPQNSSREGYILGQYVANTVEELSQLIVTMLVEVRLGEVNHA